MEERTTRRMAEVVTPNIPVSTKEILTPNEAGALFGVSGWAMYKRAKNGTAPAHYMGRKLYFVKTELIEAVQAL